MSIKLTQQSTELHSQHAFNVQDLAF